LYEFATAFFEYPPAGIAASRTGSGRRSGRSSCRGQHSTIIIFVIIAHHYDRDIANVECDAKAIAAARMAD